MNYGNRNASSIYTTEDIMKGYVAASTISIGIGMTFMKLANPHLARLSGWKFVALNAIINILA